jgi:hypothetical protein
MAAIGMQLTAVDPLHRPGTRRGRCWTKIRKHLWFVWNSNSCTWSCKYMAHGHTALLLESDGLQSHSMIFLGDMDKWRQNNVSENDPTGSLMSRFLRFWGIPVASVANRLGLKDTTVACQPDSCTGSGTEWFQYFAIYLLFLPGLENRD